MKRNDSRAVARLKRMYKRLKDYPLIKKKDGKWRACESITEFLSLKWAKVFKNTGSYTKGMSEKLDAKQKNRKERHSKKKIIEEGIQEYESRYDEYYCPQCMHCVEGYCVEKHKWVNGNDYCEDFFD
jgi:hypothetical protein